MKSKLHQLLQQAGSKATPGRLRVLNVLEKSKMPLSIQQIWDKVGQQRLDQVTLYRMLQAFKKAGVVRKIDLQNNRSYYELVPSQDHHHLVCSNCGRMEDIVGCGVDDVLHTILKRSVQFSRLTEHSFEVFGVCKTCDKKSV